jgi:hypothetical protein
LAAEATLSAHAAKGKYEWGLMRATNTNNMRMACFAIAEKKRSHFERGDHPEICDQAIA